MSNKVTCLGKLFLIQDALKTSPWKLHGRHQKHWRPIPAYKATLENVK